MLAACTLGERLSCFSTQDYEEPLMFGLNEEDEEDDLLETIAGRVCFIHSLSFWLIKSLCKNCDFFFFFSSRILIFTDTFLLARRA